MAADDSSGPRPPGVVLRIKLRYEDVDVMVQRFAPNVGKSGLFLPTRSVQPLGAEIKFELRLADDKPVLIGLGRVKALKEPDPENPKASFGMAIELMRVTRESRDLIMRMLERRNEMGLPEVAIPMPADIEAVRRPEGVDPSVGPVPSTIPVVDSGPESLLSSPRRPSGPIAIAKRATVVAPLTPEGPRRKRIAVSELIESASGPIAAIQVGVAGFDEDLDISAVLARARALAGGSMDAELEALLEIAAAPLEISIEAASAELARQLGGAAVNRRDRSPRWAPPPSMISTPVPTEPKLQRAPGEGEAAVAPARETPPPKSKPVPVQVPAPEHDLRAAFIAMMTHIDDVESSPVHMVTPPITDQNITEPSHVALAAAPEMLAGEDDHENPDPQSVAPELIDDEILQLTDEDFEEVDPTQLGEMAIDPAAFDQHAFVTEPGFGHEELSALFDGQPAAAEPEPPGEPDEDSEELDDFEILAEANEDDADLLSSHGEADASDDTDVPRELRQASDSDFASRLDLDDNSGLYTPVPISSPRELSGRHASFSELDQDRGEPRRPRERSQFDEPASYIPEVRDPFDPDSGYTLAGDLPTPSFEFDTGHAGFSIPHDFDQSDVSHPGVLGGGDSPMPSPPIEDPYDLETALEALDVDLDDLSIPHALTELVRERPGTTGLRPIASPRAITPAPREQGRANTEDGIEIDFEDDDL